MSRLLALPALLLTAYSTSIVGCGGTNEAIAADASGGAGLSAGGGNSDSGGNSRHSAGASSSGGPGVAGGPSEPPSTSEAGSDSSTGIGTSTSSGAPLKCGNKTCDGATEYCNLDSGDPQPDGGFDSFGCMPLPSECLATPTCSCLASHDVEPACTCTETDGLRVGCAAM